MCEDLSLCRGCRVAKFTQIYGLQSWYSHILHILSLMWIDGFAVIITKLEKYWLMFLWTILQIIQQIPFECLMGKNQCVVATVGGSHCKAKWQMLLHLVDSIVHLAESHSQQI